MTLSSPYVFVETTDVVDYAAPQRFMRKGDWLIAELVRKGTGNPASVSGILRMDDKGDGIRFTADPGAVPEGGTPVETSPSASLPSIWWLLVGVLLIGFAVTDGYDLGLGAIYRFIARDDTERRMALEAIEPHWEGHQVWFILGGGAVFAAWPMLYAASFSGFYFAMLLVLLALSLRPVGFNFRNKVQHPAWRNGWDWALMVAGAVPSLVFGVAFGNLFLGVINAFTEQLREQAHRQQPCVQPHLGHWSTSLQKVNHTTRQATNARPGSSRLQERVRRAGTERSRPAPRCGLRDRRAGRSGRSSGRRSPPAHG